MKFTEYSYSRPDMGAYSAMFVGLLESFERAGTAEEQSRRLADICRARIEFETTYQLAVVRHTQDTTVPDYAAEQQFFDENKPLYDELVSRFYARLVRSRFRGELEERWGRHLFALAELSLNVVSPAVLDDLGEENRLVSEYNKLLASARIAFKGQERNLSGMQQFLVSDERETRRLAAEAKWGFFSENAGRFDDIFDRLVQVRTRIARKLGYPGFVELAYARLMRTDYDAGMVAGLRAEVERHLVPLLSQLKREQAARLGLPRMDYYDEALDFRGGNPGPKGGAGWIVEQSQRMFAEMSAETREFFNFMLENELMDLLTRPGKASGGYCVDFKQYGAPFIFANFTGTSIDVDILTHEAGHAFQNYQSRHFEAPEYRWPTLDACEIHSMSMEYFAWPWMHLFFAEETDKFRYAHVTTSVHYLCYRAAIDEFQHFVYEHPEATPGERKQAWLALENRYLPDRNFAGNEFLRQGGGWQQQLHVYAAPFYFIDYNLAEMCAFQFWAKSEEDWGGGWADYLRLCRAGGSASFLQLVELSGLASPFSEGHVEALAGRLRTWLSAAAARL